MQLQESGEMYLETIYILSRSGAPVRSIDVSEYMGFSKPSVSRAVGILKKGGYLLMDNDGHGFPYSPWCKQGYCSRGCLQDGACHKRRNIRGTEAACAPVFRQIVLPE